MTLDIVASPLEEKKILELTHNDDSNFSLIKLGFFEALSLRIFGFAKVGSVVTEDRLRREAYLFRCEKHGLQVAFPDSWSEKLSCGVCLHELSVQLEERCKKQLEDEKKNPQYDSDKTTEVLKKYRTNKQNLK